MSKSYSIKTLHLNQLRDLKRKIEDDMRNKGKHRELRQIAEAEAARAEWQDWKANCKPLRGKQLRLL